MSAELQEHLGFAADFRIGEWLVEPSLDRVSRAGTVLRLRPQLVNLLVLLARHAGRTVSKETILAEVWEGQHVAESGMTRCVAEIRQALGDDAHAPRIIETIPKRGYRLVAPVVFLEASGTVDAKDAACQSPAAANPASAVPEGALEQNAAPVPRLPLLGRVGWPLGSTLGVLLLLVVAWVAAGWSRAPAVAARDTVLLADVTNTTGDTSFDKTLQLALAAHVGQAPYLNVLSGDHLRRAMTLMGRPADQPVAGPIALELCRRERAATLLAGSIARLGSHYALGIEAIACDSGDSIHHELLEVESKEQVLTALGTAAARLRRRLGDLRLERASVKPRYPSTQLR